MLIKIESVSETNQYYMYKQWGWNFLLKETIGTLID